MSRFFAFARINNQIRRARARATTKRYASIASQLSMLLESADKHRHPTHRIVSSDDFTHEQMRCIDSWPESWFSSPEDLED